MDRDPNNSELFNSLHPKDEETDKSFVGKVKSIITNTPLSKWFWRQDDNGSTVRIRDEEFEDEEILEMQPPTKRVKLPVDSEASNCNTIYFKQTSTNTTADKIPKTEFISLHEPVAGPSGINSRKLHSNATTSTTYSARSVFNTNELINGHKDSDSDESTSGYSSVPRISSKEQVCGSQESSKQTSPLQSSPRNSRSLFQTSTMNSTRSLFAERSLSPNVNTSMSSRRPSFNASTFGSPNFIDKTIATKKVVESPFYNGRTIYGGASAYSRSLGRSSQDLKSSLRNSVDVKPVNKTSDNGNVVLGKTAQRILDTLEQYSTPINDAKKIPLATRKRGGLLSEYTGTNPYIIRHSKVASNKELQVPSVPDLLKMKQRMRLQDSTEIVKQIAASSKSNLNAQLYSIHTNENEKEKHTSKVRTKISAPHRQKQLDMEPAPEVHLNPVSLPITTLPKFDLKIPPPESLKRDSENISRALKQSEKSLLSKSPQAQLSRSKTLETETNHKKRTTTADIVDYKFSDPLVISENIKSIIAINDFKFSEPVCKKSKPESLSNSTLNFKMPENKASILPITGKTNTVGQKESPTLLKTGSVMDILGKKDTSLMEKFKPPQGTWECTVCMVRNQPEKTKCVACETPKVMPDKQNLNKDGFGSQFKLSSDKWECSSCMVRNNNSDMKCVACTSPKPGTIAVSNTTTPKTNTSGFGGKFKLSSDSWECPTCMIRNKNELTKCAACETANPKVTTTLLSTMNKFLPPPSSWECTTCLVKNKEGDLKCVACETPKAGEKNGTHWFWKCI
ncbi:hypothetical protein NQ317_016321 [Molorchus minor]|uniref:Nuclear pore complex protein Nup153 n=1 Tax=Molorchus minor TaxID=1323400 RepID=A0ABQ9J1Z8_9CUCU|nr:hypothetical protein NQ317_016321 [Molorchus minor]